MQLDHTEFALGQRIPGTKYVLCGVLGKGGMGVVYDVVKAPGIRGAMKVMYPSMVTRPDCVARFFDEVRLLARLRHKNIVAVYDFDTLGDGTPFLVMEKLEGETLRSTLRKSARSTQGFPAHGAYEVTRQTCEGLYRAHTQPSPVVHRDIKPENLFLNQLAGSDEVEVKVLDFGVAALVDGQDRGQFGTPRYMAPEQFRGERATPKSDLYAMALVLYEMLTGRFPWDAERDSDLCHAHLFVEPAPLSRFAPWVPRSIDALMARSLAKDPARRPHSVFAFASQLYELQWIDAGRSRALGVNTTAPTLTALVSASNDSRRDGGGSGHDTFRGITPPPMEGPSLELFARMDTRPSDGRGEGETIQLATPDFLPASAARPAKRSTSNPAVDREAATREQLAPPNRVPMHGTQPIAAPRSGAPHAADRSPSRPPLAAPPTEATPMAGIVALAASGAPRRAPTDLSARLVPFAVFAVIVIVGTAFSIVATRGGPRASAFAAGEESTAARVIVLAKSAPAAAVVAVSVPAPSAATPPAPAHSASAPPSPDPSATALQVSAPSRGSLDTDASAPISADTPASSRPLAATPRPSGTGNGRRNQPFATY
jgi:eukaryotic-like serine/threonine-protein kinase